MKSSEQQQLDFGAVYPNRPPVWFAHAIRVMSHYAVASEVGLLGYAILMEVVLTEDKRGYSSPPKFWQSSFQDRFGRKKDAVSEAIHRCVEKGWLHWHQPCNRRQAIAWLTIPTHIDESVVKRHWSEFPPNDPTNDPTNHPPKDPTNHPPSSSLALALPKDDVWAAVELEMAENGICATEKPLRILQERKVPPDLALAVLRYASEVKLWKPGKVRCRLCQLRPGQDPTDAKLWPPSDKSPGHPAAASTVSVAQSREMDARLQQEKQLQFDFERRYGSQLDELTDDELVDLIRDTPRTVDSFRKLGREKFMPVMRPVLLRAMHARYGGADG